MTGFNSGRGRMKRRRGRERREKKENEMMIRIIRPDSKKEIWRILILTCHVMVIQNFTA